MPDKSSDLDFSSEALWQESPLEAFTAWLLSPTFVVTKKGVEQPLRDSSAQVYKFMGRKFIREVILLHPGDRGEPGQPGRHWREVSPEIINEFLVRNDLRRGIRNRYIRLIERIYDHLIENGVVSHNPARGLALKAPSKSNQAHEGTMWLTDEQQIKLSATLPVGTGWKEQRIRALIATLLGGGLKVSEVLMLKDSMVGPKQADGSLYIEVPPVGAGRQHRTKVAPWAASILLNWLQAKSEFGLPRELTFPASAIGGRLHRTTVYRQVAAVLSATGIDPEVIKRRGARTLRNSYTMKELINGQPIEIVGEYLGLRTERSVEYYTEQLKRTER